MFIFIQLSDIQGEIVIKTLEIRITQEIKVMQNLDSFSQIFGDLCFDIFLLSTVSLRIKRLRIIIVSVNSPKALNFTVYE